MKKYKYILTLPHGEKIDSSQLIEGHVVWPNYSQADPVSFKGVFDTYEEAKKASEEKKIYKYIILVPSWAVDSYEDIDSECGEDELIGCYLSYTDAEDAACRYLGFNSVWDVEEPRVEVVYHAAEDQQPLEGYCYEIWLGDECCEDSLYENLIYKTEKEAEEAGNLVAESMELADIVEIEILRREIVEYDDGEEAQ